MGAPFLPRFWRQKWGFSRGIGKNDMGTIAMDCPKQKSPLLAQKPREKWGTHRFFVFVLGSWF
jgi:hypothetical protein